MRGIVEVQERQADPVDRTVAGDVDPVIHDEPAGSAVSSGGGPRPILPASHQAPSRASSSRV